MSLPTLPYFLLLPKDTNRKIRKTFSIEYYGISLVPNHTPGAHTTVLSPVFTLLEQSLEPIKLPQMYINLAFLIFLLVSLLLSSGKYHCQNKFPMTF